MKGRVQGFLSDSTSMRRLVSRHLVGYQVNFASLKLDAKANVTLRRLRTTSPVLCAQTSSVEARTEEGRFEGVWEEEEGV